MIKLKLKQNLLITYIVIGVVMVLAMAMLNNTRINILNSQKHIIVIDSTGNLYPCVKNENRK